MTLPRTGSSSASGDHPSGEDGPVDGETIKIRRSRLEYGDGGTMWRLARESGVLEENAEYTYHMFSHFFGETCTVADLDGEARSEAHTSELQSLMRTSYAVFCLTKKSQTRSHLNSRHLAINHSLR